jgi:hypothetical protein
MRAAAGGDMVGGLKIQNFFDPKKPQGIRMVAKELDIYTSQNVVRHLEDTRLRALLVLWYYIEPPYVFNNDTMYLALDCKNRIVSDLTALIASVQSYFLKGDVPQYVPSRESPYLRPVQTKLGKQYTPDDLLEMFHNIALTYRDIVILYIIESTTFSAETKDAVIYNYNLFAEECNRLSDSARKDVELNEGVSREQRSDDTDVRETDIFIYKRLPYRLRPDESVVTVAKHDVEYKKKEVIRMLYDVHERFSAVSAYIGNELKLKGRNGGVHLVLKFNKFSDGISSIIDAVDKNAKFK